MTVVIVGVVIRIAERRPSGTMATTELPENRRPDDQDDEPEGNDHKEPVDDHHNPRLVVRSNRNAAGLVRPASTRGVKPRTLIGCLFH
jgi:hypothetical protein